MALLSNFKLDYEAAATNTANAPVLQFLLIGATYRWNCLGQSSW